MINLVERLNLDFEASPREILRLAIPSIPLMPHAVCWKADPQLIWTMVVTNAITFLSYLIICLTLFFLVRRTRRVIARDWAYFAVGFALFIVACGSTHMMDVVTTWVPWFWIDAGTNIVTALLSAWVAIMLIRRANTIAFSINDYAQRLGNTEKEKLQMQLSLVDARKLEDWSRMSTVVAHEISNPIESIQNLLYLIEHSEGVKPQVVELAQTAAAEADRVITISRSTLAFFRQSGEMESVNLLAAAESVKFVLGTLFQGSAWQLQIESEGDVWVRALPGEVRQVLLNLVRNAYEASTGTKAKIKVTLNGKQDGVELIVADEGTGIDPAILPELFHFGASTKGDQGNGMGLWCVKQIVQRHGGKIAVESKLGVGTQFSIWWPRNAELAGSANLMDSAQ